MAAIAPALRAALMAAGGSGGGGLAGGAASSSALAALNDGLGNTAKGATDAATSLGGLKDVFGHFKAMRSEVDGLAGGLGKIVTGTNLFFRGLDALEGAFDKVNAALDTAIMLTSKYVKTFAPAEAELFNNALKDMNAVLGEQLVPVTRAARDAVRWVADGLASLTPYVRGFLEDGIEKLRPVFQALGHAVESALTRAAPLAELAGNFQLVGTAIGLVTNRMAAVVEMFNTLSDVLNELLGLQRFQFADSRGKAAASTNLGSINSLLANAQRSAFSLGSESPQKVQETLLQRILTAINNLPGKIENLPKGIAQALQQEVDQRADRAADRFVGGVKNAAGPLGDLAVEALVRLPRFN